MSPSQLPPWADEMRELFRSGTCSQFVLYGAITDLVPLPGKKGYEYVSLRRFLTEAMFQPFDVVIHYDRGRGIRIRKGGEHFQRFLEAFDAFQGTSWSKLPSKLGEDSLNLGNILPREATKAFELINRFVRGSQSLTEVGEGGRRLPAPLKVAVLVDYAHFVAPRGDALRLSGERSQVLIQLLDWASDPAITGAFVTTVLLTDALGELNRMLVESPYVAKIQVELPTELDLGRFIADLVVGEREFGRLCTLEPPALAQKLVGLSR